LENRASGKLSAEAMRFPFIDVDTGKPVFTYTVR
jgi:hypothetical protein